MNTNAIRHLLLMPILLTVTGWAQPSVAQERADALRASRPKLIVTSNSGRLTKGAPLVLSVSLLHPSIVVPTPQALNSGVISIESADEGWDQFLTIEVFQKKNRTKTPVNWPLTRVGKPPRHVELTSENPRAVVRYVVSPDETAKLEPGEYYVVAKFDSNRAASKTNWKGVLSEAWTITLAESDTKTGSSGRCASAVNMFEYFNITGRPKEGLPFLDAAITGAAPGAGWACLEQRALAAEQSGNLTEARDYYCRAAADFHIGVKAEMAARKEGQSMPYYTRPSVELQCERISALLRQQRETGGP